MTTYQAVCSLLVTLILSVNLYFLHRRITKLESLTEQLIEIHKLNKNKTAE